MRRALAVAVASGVAVALLVDAGTAVAGKPLTVCASGCQFATISDALAAAGDGDRIAIGPGSYPGGFTIEVSVALTGAGASRTTIEGAGPVVTVAPGATVAISGVTVTGGSGRVSGGGIWNLGELVLRNSVVRDNRAFDGGDVSNVGTLTLVDSTVAGGSAFVGGGIINVGTMTVQHSMVSGNNAEFGGGGIWNTGSLTLQRSRVGVNTSAQLGGGIYNEGAATIQHSAVRANTAGADGGGIFNGAGTVTIDHSAISGNAPDDCVGC